MQTNTAPLVLPSAHFAIIRRTPVAPAQAHGVPTRRAGCPSLATPLPRGCVAARRRGGTLAARIAGGAALVRTGPCNAPPGSGAPPRRMVPPRWGASVAWVAWALGAVLTVEGEVRHG